jgi:hypothetical protein
MRPVMGQMEGSSSSSSSSSTGSGDPGGSLVPVDATKVRIRMLEATNETPLTLDTYPFAASVKFALNFTVPKQALPTGATKFYLLVTVPTFSYTWATWEPYLFGSPTEIAFTTNARAVPASRPSEAQFSVEIRAVNDLGQKVGPSAFTAVMWDTSMLADPPNIVQIIGVSLLVKDQATALTRQEYLAGQPFDVLVQITNTGSVPVDHALGSAKNSTGKSYGIGLAFFSPALPVAETGALTFGWKDTGFGFWSSDRSQGMAWPGSVLFSVSVYFSDSTVRDYTIPWDLSELQMEEGRGRGAVIVFFLFFDRCVQWVFHRCCRPNVANGPDPNQCLNGVHCFPFGSYGAPVALG